MSTQRGFATEVLLAALPGKVFAALTTTEGLAAGGHRW